MMDRKIVIVIVAMLCYMNAKMEIAASTTLLDCHRRMELINHSLAMRGSSMTL
jgi:hypothetical protein